MMNGGSDEKGMKFVLNIVDSIFQLREKYKKREFTIGYRLSPEEPYEDGLTITETLKLVKKPIQYIHISQKYYFKKARRGEKGGIEKFKTIHEETKEKVALIGIGGIKDEKDFISALNSGFSVFIRVGVASMINKDLGILLKEGKADKLSAELDPEHKEKYSLPNNLWNIWLQDQDWLPPLKGKPRKKVEE